MPPKTPTVGEALDFFRKRNADYWAYVDPPSVDVHAAVLTDEISRLQSAHATAFQRGAEAMRRSIVRQLREVSIVREDPYTTLVEATNDAACLPTPDREGE